MECNILQPEILSVDELTVLLKKVLLSFVMFRSTCIRGYYMGNLRKCESGMLYYAGDAGEAGDDRQRSMAFARGARRAISIARLGGHG